MRVLLFFLKLNSRLIFNQRDIYCNTHGSFVIIIQLRKHGFYLFKDIKIQKLWY
jgi:hypothetical protein